MTNFKEIQISEIFDIEKGKSLYTNTYITGNVGSFPVFSSQTTNNGEIGKINTYDYDKSCITWTTDGVHAGTVFIRENIKFSMTTHCGALILKKEYLEKISLSYVYYFLSVFLKQYAIGTDNKRITSGMIKDIFIKIPLDEDGEFDLENQQEIAGKYEKLEKLKDRIRIMKEDIEEVGVKLTEIGKGKEVSISEIFDLNRGKSIYTRKYGDLNKGDFPVYSAGKEQLTSINTYDFDGKYLTWATNGFAGYLKKINGKFSINADRGICIAKTDKIDIDFIRFSIQTDLRNLTKGRVGDKGKNEFTKLSPDKIKENIIIKIPVKENGEFDLEKQKEIAFKYEKIEKIQRTLVEELEYLEKVKVEI